MSLKQYVLFEPLPGKLQRYWDDHIYFIHSVVRSNIPYHKSILIKNEYIYYVTADIVEDHVVLVGPPIGIFVDESPYTFIVKPRPKSPSDWLQKNGAKPLPKYLEVCFSSYWKKRLHLICQTV